MNIKVPSHAKLVQHAKRRSRLVAEKLKKAMVTIEAEISASEGIYSFNGGRLSRAELCRRADIRSAILEGPAHKLTTKVDVAEWLAGVQLGITQGRKAVRRKITERADTWKVTSQGYADKSHLYHLKMISLENRLVEANEKIRRLEAENLRLAEALSKGQVVRLNVKPKR